MPANLNALLRYKTIDNCLSNPYKLWTIANLTEACSANLKESRGIETGVSERTIREDIRVMRSDLLGFNAPIVQHDGHYSYEDPSYSIFHVNIKEKELLKRVLNFILELQEEIVHPGIEEIINSISNALPAEDSSYIQSDKHKSKETYLLRESDEYLNSAFLDRSIIGDERIDEETINEDEELLAKSDFLWSGVLDLLDC